jgi:hypothetical protein
MTTAKVFLRECNCARNRHGETLVGAVEPIVGSVSTTQPASGQPAPTPPAPPAAKVRACVTAHGGTRTGAFVRDLPEMGLGIVVNCIRPIIFGCAATGVGYQGVAANRPPGLAVRRHGRNGFGDRWTDEQAKTKRWITLPDAAVEIAMPTRCSSAPFYAGIATMSGNLRRELLLTTQN